MHVRSREHEQWMPGHAVDNPITDSKNIAQNPTETKKGKRKTTQNLSKIDFCVSSKGGADLLNIVFWGEGLSPSFPWESRPKWSKLPLNL